MPQDELIDSVVFGKNDILPGIVGLSLEAEFVLSQSHRLGILSTGVCFTWDEFVPQCFREHKFE